MLSRACRKLILETVILSRAASKSAGEKPSEINFSLKMSVAGAPIANKPPFRQKHMGDIGQNKPGN
jgi:hypothetical protein